MNVGATSPHFVVSTGRCGSTLLSSLLAAHPDVLNLSEVFSAIGPDRVFARDVLDGTELFRLLSEPRPEIGDLLSASTVPELDSTNDGYGVAPLCLAALRGLSEDPRKLLAELEPITVSRPRAAAALGFARVFDWLRVRLGKRLWVERSGGSLAYVERICRFWPQSKLVHLWRDGVHTAMSMSRHPYFRVAVAQAHTRNPLLDVRSALSIDVPLDRFAAYWTATMLRGLSTLEAHGSNNVLTLRYETLLDEPQRELTRLAVFLGFSASPDWLSVSCSRIRRPPGHSNDSLTDAERKALARLCDPVRRKLERLAT
jgi:hypothetical protein